MKNYVVKAIDNFTDGVENVPRIANESVFECTKERYEFLKSENAVELVEIIEIVCDEETEEATEETKTKKSKVK